MHALLRAQVPFYEADRFFAPDIEAARKLVVEGALSAACADVFATLYQ